MLRMSRQARVTLCAAAFVFRNSMPCFHPLTGWRSQVTNPSGKRGITFKASEGFIDMPVTVPCGQCIGCRIDRVGHWSTRIVQEGRFHERKCFLTLTYSPDKLPENGSLSKRDFQLFMKRLRAAYGSGLRFFACGEYGESMSRPHYHAIIFGCDFPDRKKISTSGDHPLYRSETLDKLWGFGHAWIGSVTEDSARYVASYVIKKINGEAAAAHYTRINPGTGEIFCLAPEFVLMSRRPGIGSDYYENFKTDIYPSDFVITSRGAKPRPVPKFYDRRLEKDDPKLLEKLKARRVRKASRRKADHTPERLAVRETVARARLSLKRRFI